MCPVDVLLSAVGVDPEPYAVGDQARGVSNADNGGDAKFARNDRWVALLGADSNTTAAVQRNKGVQAGSVMGAMRIALGSSPRGSAGSSTTRARLSATPGHTPIPRMTDCGGSPAGAPSRSGQLAGSEISPSNQSGGMRAWR